IHDPETREVIAAQNEMITPSKAKLIERLGIDKVAVRSPMTCQATLGICRMCYGMDLATGAMVEEGMAVGIIAAQSIGEPGTQLTMPPFHIGGVATGKLTADSEVKTKKGGIIQLERINVVTNEQGQRIALARTGEILIAKGKDQPPLERFPVPN